MPPCRIIKKIKKMAKRQKVTEICYDSGPVNEEFDLKEAMGGPTQILARAARETAIAKNRAAMVDFFEDEIREWHWYLDPKNHDAVAQIASDLTKQPPERFGWLYTKTDYYRAPNMVPDLDALQKNVDMTKALGFVNASFDVKAHSDLSLIKEAAKRLQ